MDVKDTVNARKKPMTQLSPHVTRRPNRRRSRSWQPAKRTLETPLFPVFFLSLWTAC